MSEKSDAAFKRVSDMIWEIEDPVELQTQLREMIEQEFPVRPAFEKYETMPMHEFEKRLRASWCNNVEPVFAQLEVHVMDVPDGLALGLMVEITTPNGLNGAKPEGRAVERLERSEAVERLERPALGEVEG